MRVSLEPARDLCARLGQPERAFLVVHVAGTKGKGTTCSLVADALREAGVREGLYTSPHVERVTERVRIGGLEVADDTLAVALEAALEARGRALAEGGPGGEATWFDVLTAAAFSTFAEAGVELAVVKCGLGGRLDSTNVVQSSVTAVTNIYLEHMAILGKTRRAIAFEKAGIVKRGGVVVVGALEPADEATLLIERVARERGASSVRVEHEPDDSLELRNQRLAQAILCELERREPGLAARSGGFRLAPTALERARLPGRAERRWVGSTRVVLDRAHVPESLALLLADLARDPELRFPPVVVIGMGQEKSARRLLKALLGRVDRVLCSSVGEGPYRNAEELSGLARELGLDARSVTPPRAALDQAVQIAATGGWVLVTGSLHLIGALRRHTRP